MSRNFKPLLSALAFTAACAGEIPTGPASAPEIRAGKHTSVQTRHAGGKCTTTFVPAGFAFPLATIAIQGECKLKNLEHATLSATQVINVLTGDLTNSTTYTAKNGDVLYSTFVGTSTSSGPNVVFQGTETYSGGTGRFASATGSSDIAGMATLDISGSGTGQYHSKGTITF